MSDWAVHCSDGEDTPGGFYEPSDPNVIIKLYEAIQKGEIPKFNATIYPRREPNQEKQVENIPETQSTGLEETPEREKEEPTEFDFDTQPDDNVKKFTPRRTPSRPQTKKVAKMENVFSDIMKYKKMEEEQIKEEKTEEKTNPEPQAN